jgi:hypothetical protein
MTVEDADANCREVEGSGQGKLDDSPAALKVFGGPGFGEELPLGWRRVYDFDKADYSEGYDHVSGAWCRKMAGSDADDKEWFVGADPNKSSPPTEFDDREAAMAAALRGGK